MKYRRPQLHTLGGRNANNACVSGSAAVGTLITSCNDGPSVGTQCDMNGNGAVSGKAGPTSNAACYSVGINAVATMSSYACEWGGGPSNTPGACLKGGNAN